MNRKALFFDIDGTLMSEVTRQVPESATKALAAVRENGHLVFVNTGRTLSELEQIRKMVDADGWLCGCGTYIEAEGRVLYYKALPRDRQMEICRLIEEADIDGVMEGRDGCYFPSPVSRIEHGNRLRRSIDFAVRSYDWKKSCGEAQKFCLIVDRKSDKAGFFRRLGTDIHVIDRGDDFFECLPEGHSKATAIDRVLEEYGLTLQDAYVFGDSANDLSMFEHVPYAIAMGKHSPELDPYTTLVTGTVEQDGIAWALEKLGLLEK